MLCKKSFQCSCGRRMILPVSSSDKGDWWCLREPWYGDKVAYSVTATWQASEYSRSPLQCLTPQFSPSTLSLMLCRHLFVPWPLKRYCAFCITLSFLAGDIRVPESARWVEDFQGFKSYTREETSGNSGILRSYRVWGCENTSSVSEAAVSVSSWKTG